MECSFEVRKQELERECVISENLFSPSLERLTMFIEPFLSSMNRQYQREYAATVVCDQCSDLQRKNAESLP